MTLPQDPVHAEAADETSRLAKQVREDPLRRYVESAGNLSAKLRPDEPAQPATAGDPVAADLNASDPSISGKNGEALAKFYADLAAFLKNLLGNLWWEIIRGTALALLLAAGALLAMVLPGVLTWAWPRVEGHLASDPIRVFATAMVGLTALALYFVRKHSLRAYAIGEMIAGISIVWGTLAHPPNGGQAVALALAGGIYVIVRGIDNFATALKRQKEASDAEG